MSARSPAADSAGLRTQVKAALARWVLHKRRALVERDGQRPGAHDEATHAWDGRRRFAEDYLFIAAQADFGLLARLEWMPGRAAHRVWLMVLRKDGVWWVPPDETIVTQASVDRWNVAGLSLDCVQPLLRWSVRYEGRLCAATAAGERPPATSDRRARRCSIDLVFDALAPPFVPGVDDDPDLVARRLGEAHWDPALLRAVRRATQRGYVQTGRFDGTAVLGDEVTAVRAVGLRQHTWGVRDWGAPEQTVQALLVDGDTVVWIQRAEFPALVLEGGFVAEGPTLRPIRALPIASCDAGACVLALDTEAGPRRWDGELGATATMRVDGRGAVDLAHVAGPGALCGLWATQRRTLPRALALR